MLTEEETSGRERAREMFKCELAASVCTSNQAWTLKASVDERGAHTGTHLANCDRCLHS